jgi:hypothetical protein
MMDDFEKKEATPEEAKNLETIPFTENIKVAFTAKCVVIAFENEEGKLTGIKLLKEDFLSFTKFVHSKIDLITMGSEAEGVVH